MIRRKKEFAFNSYMHLVTSIIFKLQLSFVFSFVLYWFVSASLNLTFLIKPYPEYLRGFIVVI